MTLDDALPTENTMRSLWEALFSLHIGLAAGAVAFAISFPMASFFSRMETRIKIFLHLRQTDLVHGHLAAWIPSVLMALAVWILLRATARRTFTQEFLRSVAGILTICIPVVVWAIIYRSRPWPIDWRWVTAPLEMAIALLFTLRIMAGRWRVPSWAGLLLLVVHFVFWYVAPGSGHSWPGYVGIGGPMLGLCASIAWGLYVIRLKKDAMP